MDCQIPSDSLTSYTDLLTTWDRDTVQVLPLRATDDPRVLLLGPAYPLSSNGFAISPESEVVPTLSVALNGPSGPVPEPRASPADLRSAISIGVLPHQYRTPDVPERPFAAEPPSSELTCQFCQRNFKNKYEITRHLRTHTKEKPFPCIYCGKRFVQQSHVSKHLLKHMEWNPEQHLNTDVATRIGHLPDSTLEGTELNKGFQCKLCSASPLPTYDAYRAHMRTHSNEKVFRCVLPTCDQMISTPKGLMSHVKSHEALREFVCDFCGAPFDDLQEFSQHRFAHRTPRDEATSGRFEFRCDFCMDRFEDADELKNHLANENHFYKCSKCPRRYSAERYLRRHLTVHLSEGGNLCQQCGKQFKERHHLTAHLLIHSEKTFGCALCAKTFTRADQLTRHVKTVHEAHQFRCEDCNKCFSRKDKLKEHQKFRQTRCATSTEHRS